MRETIRERLKACLTQTTMNNIDKYNTHSIM